MRVLVTGVAGFIGSHVAYKLLERGDEVFGVDNMGDYYDTALKEARVKRLTVCDNFNNRLLDLANTDGISALYKKVRPDRVVHLAAQPGVRHSLTHPHVYIDSNVKGYLNILENCRHFGTEHLVYASTSSVYGANQKVPFTVKDGVGHPVSLYAATKRSNELMAHAYSHLFGVPSTGLRFFTVYGPWGRPDMALFIFTRKILAGEPIPVFNHGQHRRDFTYIDDITDGVIKVLDSPPKQDPSYDWMAPTPESASTPFRLYNIGHGEPVALMEYIHAIEEELGIKANMRLLPKQPGDMDITSADVSHLKKDFGYEPKTTVREGVAKFIHWYRAYYGV